MRFAAPADRAASSRGDLTSNGTKAPAAKRLWRCRFCRTLLLVVAGLVRCNQCHQETVVLEAA